MIVRAALAALACLAARVAGQTKQCDPSIPEIIFRRKMLDDAASGGVAVLAADLNGDSDVDIAAAFYSSEEFRWYKNKLYSNTTTGNITFNQHTRNQIAPGLGHFTAAQLTLRGFVVKQVYFYEFTHSQPLLDKTKQTSIVCILTSNILVNRFSFI